MTKEELFKLSGMIDQSALHPTTGIKELTEHCHTAIKWHASNTIIALLFMAAVLSGCGTDKTPGSPFYDSVLSAVMESNQDITELSFYEFSVTDSVTYAEQMEASGKLFRVKRDYMASKADQFKSQKKKKNAALWEAKVAQTDSLLLRLDSLFVTLQSRTGDNLYYICRFSGNGKHSNGTIAIFDGWYATVSPEGEVFNILSEPEKIRQGMGRALPGYFDVTSD